MERCRGFMRWLVLAWVAGCGDGGGDATPAPPRYQLVMEAGGDVSLRRDAVELARVPVDGLALGVVDSDASWNYDPYWLEVEGLLADLVEQPEGLRWLRPTGVVADGDALVLSYAEGRAARLEVLADVADAGGGRQRIVLTPEAGNEAVAYLQIAFAVGADERFYGLGNHHDRPELRGKRVALQLEPAPELDTFYNERHVTTPLLVATSGWAALFESDHPGVVDVARADPTRVVATFGVGLEGPGRALPLRVFLADHPLDVYRHYYAVTGPPRVPADWGFGPVLWRDETPGEGELVSSPDAVNPGVLNDLATIRALDLPASGYWIDRPYASALQTFDFDPARYDDPAAMITTAHDLGFRVALWHTPYMTEAAGALYEETVRLGGFPPVTGLALNTFDSMPIDFTNPAAAAFWSEQLATYTALGIEGYKLDFGEDIVPGLPGLRTNVWEFMSGEDERTMHARYATLYHAPYVAQMQAAPGSSGFILARAGNRGGHTHVDVLWPGDLDADFAAHGDNDGEDAGGRVGGIPAALSYQLSVTASGFPFFAADTGGYRNGPPSAEAFSRWFEMTALAPVMQIGGDDNHVAWELAAFGFDAALLDRYRELTRLHLRLFPFFRAEAARLLEDGRPIVRALGLARPELGRHPADEYLLGDALLVAPVVVEGAVERTLELPPGRWIDWWDGSERVVAGPGAERVTVAAPLGRPPLFLAAGAIVPLLRPGVDTLAPVAASHAADIDSAADVPGRLWVRVVRGPDATFRLHDGGLVEVAGDRVTWTAGTRFGPGVVIELVADAATGARLRGAELPAIAPEAFATGQGARRDEGALWIVLSGSGSVKVE